MTKSYNPFNTKFNYMKPYFIFSFMLLLGSVKAQPPNNAIFSGGAGDGFAYASWSVAANNIFAGGPGDGAAYSLSANTANSIYLGGAGDGEAWATNGAIPNAIYLGGQGDGFSFETNNALPNAIFRGGEGDGWHAVILPMGPLPVKLESFTAEHAGISHLVKWTTAEEINTLHFEVQRSPNARDFMSLGTVRPSGNNANGAAYSFRVDKPLQGNNFYRLKIVDNDGSFVYSNIVLLKNEGSLEISVYPNPTADALHIKLPHSGASATVKALLYDAQGRLLMQPVLKTGLINEVNVAMLPAGLYSIRCKLDGKLFVFRFAKQR